MGSGTNRLMGLLLTLVWYTGGSGKSKNENPEKSMQILKILNKAVQLIGQKQSKSQPHAMLLF